MKRVVIIGAGPAGLTAAYEFLKKNKSYEIIVLEESSKVGGISKTIVYNGNRMDLGGHRFFTKDKDVMKLWETILPLGNENNKKVLLERSRVSHIFYNRKFFDYPVNLSFKTIKNLGLKDTINF
jgi:protoporphyrinogen oxidase